MYVSAPAQFEKNYTEHYLIENNEIYGVPANTISTHQTNSLYVNGFVKTTGFLKLP